MFDSTLSFMRNAIFRYLFAIYSTLKVKINKLQKYCKKAILPLNIH